MSDFLSILPLPVMALICVGMLSLILLLLSKPKKSDKQVKSKWKTSEADEKPEFRGNLSVKEVAKHNHVKDAWIIVDGKVYDVTTYVDLHPGGDAILRNVGADSSEGFHGPQHPVSVTDVIAEYYIGDIVS